MAEFKISSAILADPDFKSLIIEKIKKQEISEPFLYRTKNGEEYYFFLGKDDYLMYSLFPVKEGAKKIISLDFFISKKKREEMAEKEDEEVEIIIDEDEI